MRDDANVDIRNLEGGPFDIIVDQGTCHMKNLRGSHLRVKTNGGRIECESQLLFEFGNLDTKKKGKISVKKLQGKEFCLKTDNGAIYVGASYVLKAQLSTESGNIKLGDIHGEYTMLLLENVLRWTLNLSMRIKLTRAIALHHHLRCAILSLSSSSQGNDYQGYTKIEFLGLPFG